MFDDIVVKQTKFMSSDDVHTFQLFDIRIEDNHPKVLEVEDKGELLGDSFYDALSASKYIKRSKECDVFMFGRTDKGESICVTVKDFKPFLFFRKNIFLNKDDLLSQIVNEINTKETNIWNHIKSTDLKVTEYVASNGYGYEPNEDNTGRKKFEYYKVFFPNKKTWNVISNKENISEISSHAHEKNVECITRFINETKIKMGWITVQGEPVYEKCSTCTYEVECTMDNITNSPIKGFSKFRIGYFDIETLGLETSLPICTIGITVRIYGHERKSYVFQVGHTASIEGVIVIYCKDEKDLLEKIRDFIIDQDLDSLVSYNGTNFDENFMYERALICKAERFFYCSKFAFRKCFKKKIPLSSSGMGDNELTIFDTAGICHFDWYIKFKMEDKEPSYKLQYYGEKYCGKGKDDVKYWEIEGLANGTPENRARLAKYCGIDCDLLDDLERKRNIFADILNLSSVCLILPQWVYFKGQQVRYISQLVRKSRAKDMILNVPEMGWSGNSKSTYDGAIVFDPLRGYYEYEPIHVLDYASLYPSIIMSHNFSPDTLVQKKEYQQLKGVVKHTITEKQGVEYYFVTNEIGMLPEMLEDLMSARKETKKDMKIATQELESETDKDKKFLLEQEIANLDGKQKAQKISANSLYGAMGAFSTGTYVCLAAAESCTNIAREMLYETRSFLNDNYDCTVVYGDTDSCMVKFNGVTDLQESANLAKDAAKRITKMYADRGFPKKVLEFEDSLFPCLFLNKKRYIGFMYVESKDGTMIPKEIYCKGVESERRDFCELSKNIYKNVIDGLIVKRSLEYTINQLDIDMKELINEKVPFEKFILSQSLSKSYKVPENQPHLQVNENKKRRNPGSENSVGERVEYVIVEGPPNSKVAEIAEDPEYVKENNLKLDYEWYCDHQIKKPIIRLLEPIKNVPDNLFTRYCGELKRKRLKLTSFDSFVGDTTEETVPCFKPLIRTKEKKTENTVIKYKKSSLMDFMSNENNSDEVVKVPKLFKSTIRKDKKSGKK